MCSVIFINFHGEDGLEHSDLRDFSMTFAYTCLKIQELLFLKLMIAGTAEAG